jgi:hypothetical protein
VNTGQPSIFSFGAQHFAKHQSWSIRNLVVETPHTRTSQCSLHNAPIFRLLLKVAVNGTHQCESLNFCGTFCPNLHHLTDCTSYMFSPSQRHRTNVVSFELRSLMFSLPCLTVLAQDLCYSDPLSLVLTFLTHTMAVRILSLVAAFPNLCMLCMPLMFRSKQPQKNSHQFTKETQTRTRTQDTPAQTQTHLPLRSRFGVKHKP